MSQAERGWAKALEEGTKRRKSVRATYRLQLDSKFTFDDAIRILPYLKRLGISHVYASPYLKARPGSSHGYDVVDHNAINPELGGLEGFERFAAALKKQGMGHIADIVPNHVGISENCNAWWDDVLEHGRHSRYQGYFDIDWDNPLNPANRGKVLLPILGEPYIDALRDRKLKLESGDKEPYFSYFSSRLPLSAESLEFLIPEDLQGEVRALFGKLKSSPEYLEVSIRIKEAFGRLFKIALIRERIENEIAGVNRSLEKLDRLLLMQYWRAAWWKTASEEINYRRFFDINELAALKVEKRAVFEETHALIFKLLSEGKIDGLRIDHPDGLLDPQQYLSRLQAGYAKAVSGGGKTADLLPPGVKPPLYVVAEKVLGRHEELNSRWPCHGTSGYDFLTMTNSLFVDADRVKAMEKVWGGYSDGKTAGEVLREAKRLILKSSFAGQFETLTCHLSGIARDSIESRDFSRGMLKGALEELIVCFPVYRTYLSEGSADPADLEIIREALKEAQALRPQVPPQVFSFIERALRGETDRSRVFAGKLQQLSAPVTAKGVEDTAYYRYLRLLSVNEVGGDIREYGVTPPELHAYLEKRAQVYPFSLSPLSTHDTKRSEDVRARLNVLSEMPEEWGEVLNQLEQEASCIEEYRNIHPADRYLIFQSLIGAWPPGCTKPDNQFRERFAGYLEKALREAKLRTSWTNPDSVAERRILGFTEKLLEADRFYQLFLPFAEKVSWYGLLNSLSQTVIRLTAPGIPDTYQGQELWDFSLVDPDNRRPVDYTERERLLAESEGPLSEIKNMHDPQIKLNVIRLLLELRNRCPELLREGSYMPLKVEGEKESHIFSFMRRSGDVCACVIAGRFFATLCSPEEIPDGREFWKNTRIILPGSAPEIFEDVLFRRQIRSSDSGIDIGEAFSSLPVSVLVSGI